MVPAQSSTPDYLGGLGSIANLGLAGWNLLSNNDSAYNNPINSYGANISNLVNNATSVFNADTGAYSAATAPYTTVAQNIATVPNAFPITTNLSQLQGISDWQLANAISTGQNAATDIADADKFTAIAKWLANSLGGNASAQQTYSQDVAGIAPQIAGQAQNIINVGAAQQAQGEQQYGIGSTLEQSLINNTVTPAQQAALDQLQRQNTAQLLGAYGTSGMGSNIGGAPSSTPLATDLGSLAQSILAQRGQIEQQNFGSGLQAVGAGANLETAAATDFGNAANVMGLEANVLGQASNILNQSNQTVMDQGQLEQLASNFNTQALQDQAMNALNFNTMLSGAGSTTNLGLQDVLSAFEGGSGIGMSVPLNEYNAENTFNQNVLQIQAQAQQNLLQMQEQAAQAEASSGSDAMGGLGSALSMMGSVMAFL